MKLNLYPCKDCPKTITDLNPPWHFQTSFCQCPSSFWGFSGKEIPFLRHSIHSVKTEELGQKMSKVQTCPQRTLLFKREFLLVLISNLIHGALCAPEVEFLWTTHFKRPQLPYLRNIKRSLCLNLLRQDKFHGNCKCSVILVIFFFSCGVWGRADKYTLNLKLSIKQLCLYILTGLQTWGKSSTLIYL